MNIEKNYTEDHQVKLTVTIDKEPLEEAKHRAARKLAQRTRIPGFRPGKAPYNVVLRTVGESAVLQEAVDMLLDEQYPKIIEQAGIKAYGSGELDSITSMDPLTLEFTIPLEAEVTLGEYKSLRFPYELPSVTDEQVDQFVEELRDRSATMEPTNEPAKDGDVIFLRLSADRKNPKEGQTVAIINDRSTTVTVKPETADKSSEWPFPGFSRRLVGAKPGDEDTFEYAYGEDSVLENLRGTEAIFRYKVEEVKSRSLPELNDEFAKSMGEFENLEEMRVEVRKGLEEQAKTEYEKEFDNQILEAIQEKSTIKFPPQMLERELDVFLHQLEHRLQDQGLDMQTYLKTRQMTQEELRNETRPSAEARLKRSLILFQVAKEENVQVNDQDVQNEAMQTLNQLNQVYTPQEAKKMVTNEFIQNMVSNITSDLLVKNTLQRLEAYAKGEVESEAAPEAEKAAPKKRSPRAKKTAAAAKPEDAETPVPVETVAEPKAKPKRAKKTE